MTRDRYPECPERTRAIWAAMTEAGLVGGAGVVVLGRGRLLAREECRLVHGDQFWDTWVTSEDMEPRRGDSAVSGAGNEGPRSFHNHGEGPLSLRHDAKRALTHHK